MRWEGMDWIDLVQDRKRGRGLSKGRNESSSFIKCGKILDCVRSY